MNPNQAENTRRWRDRQKARGNKAVTVQCPADRVDELKALVKSWREQQ